MLTGIYILRFKGTDKVYVGKATSIMTRYTAHKNQLSNKTHTKKMNNAFELYGYPSVEVLLECSIEELNENENLAIDIFNSVENGFNTLTTAEEMPDGSNNYGELNSRAKYSNAQVLIAVDLMLANTHTLQEVSTISGINYSTILLIASGHQHKWVEKEYPEKYALLMKLKGTRMKESKSAKGRGITYPILLDPEGNEHNVDNVKVFAEKYGLNKGHLGQVLLGKEPQHKKWKLKS